MTQPINSSDIDPFAVAFADYYSTLADATITERLMPVLRPLAYSILHDLGEILDNAIEAHGMT